VQVSEYSERAAKLENMGKLFDAPASDLSPVATVAKDLELHSRKWELLCGFEAEGKAWLTQPVRIHSQVTRASVLFVVLALRLARKRPH
jgi:hypothetical protein